MTLTMILGNAVVLLAFLAVLQFIVILLLIDRNKQPTVLRIKMKRDQCVHVHLTVGVDDRLACLLAMLLDKPDMSAEAKEIIAEQTAKFKRSNDKLEKAIDANKPPK